MAELLAGPDFARAIATAFVSDVDRAPALKDAISRGFIGAEKLRQMISQDIRSNSKRFPRLGELFRSQADLQTGMGAEEASTDWFSSAIKLLTTTVVTGVTYLQGKKVLEAEKERAEATVSAVEQARQTAAKRAELDATRERLAQSQQAKREVGLVPGLGIPIWTVPVGLAAIIGGILLLKR